MNIDFKAIDVDDVFEYMKWLLLAVLVFFILFLGYKIGKNSAADEIAELGKTIAIQEMAMQEQANTLREINTKTLAAEAEAKLAKEQAIDAGVAAKNAQNAASAAQKSYAAKLARAKKTPDCEALLAQDVRKVCGL